MDGFGEWLVQRYYINRHELFRSLEIAYRFNCRIGDAVVWLGFLTRAQIEEQHFAYQCHEHAFEDTAVASAPIPCMYDE